MTSTIRPLRSPTNPGPCSPSRTRVPARTFLSAVLRRFAESSLDSPVLRAMGVPSVTAPDCSGRLAAR